MSAYMTGPGHASFLRLTQINEGTNKGTKEIFKETAREKGSN